MCGLDLQAQEDKFSCVDSFLTRVNTEWKIQVQTVCWKIINTTNEILNNLWDKPLCINNEKTH